MFPALGAVLGLLHPVAGGVLRRGLKFQTCTNTLNKFFFSNSSNFWVPPMYVDRWQQTFSTHLFFFTEESTQLWFDALFLLCSSGSSSSCSGSRCGSVGCCWDRSAGSILMQRILTAVTRRQRRGGCGVTSRPAPTYTHNTN